MNKASDSCKFINRVEVDVQYFLVFSGNLLRDNDIYKGILDSFKDFHGN
jgi:hypothetical protein